jgi:hypothetical protein
VVTLFLILFGGRSAVVLAATESIIGASPDYNNNSPFDKVQTFPLKREEFRYEFYRTKKERFVLLVYDDDDSPACCDDDEALPDATTNSCSQNEAAKRFSRRRRKG